MGLLYKKLLIGPGKDITFFSGGYKENSPLEKNDTPQKYFFLFEIENEGRVATFSPPFTSSAQETSS